MRRGMWTVRGAVAIVALLAMLGAPLAAQAAPPITGTAATVMAPAGLNLRTGPGLHYGVVFTLRQGETVYVQGGPTWAGGIAWRPVQVLRWGDMYDGYCASVYLSGYGGAPPDPAPGGLLRVASGAGLRLRSGPGLGYAILRTVPYGTLLRPIGPTQWADGYRWSKVGIGGLRFWAASAYLQPA